MKLLTVLLSLFLIVGCTTVPVKPLKFPDAPSALIQKCEKLKTIDNDQVSVVDMIKVVVENYTLYHECSLKVDGWIEWHKKQKENHESIK
jgi:hypothetical protein